MSGTSDTGRRIAVIDIGTNTLLLLVAEVRASDAGVELVPLHEACEFGRLGKGLDASGNLAPEAVARSLDIVRGYRQIMDEHSVSEIRAVGTQALREAGNAAEFVTPAVSLLGSSIEIIAGEREAQLVYRAVAEGLPAVAGQRFVIADVGGGSTEVIVSSADGRTMDSFVSIPIGSVRMHERHLHGDPPSAEQIRALDRDIDAALRELELPTGVRLVGSAGTATAIAGIAQKLPAYDPVRVHGYELSGQAVKDQLNMLFAMTIAERRGLAGLPIQRADVIGAGLAIFARLLDRLETDQFIVNDRGVRWGVAHELVAESPPR